MKIAILNQSEWEPQDLELVESALDAEIVSVRTTGSDATMAMSTIPGNSKFYAWNRSFNQKTPLWLLMSEDLGELIGWVKEKINEYPERHS